MTTNDPSQAPAKPAGGGRREKRKDLKLRARFEELLALRSAWGVLAPCGLWDAGQHIAETGRMLNEELNELAQVAMAARPESTLTRIDSMLDGFEREMHSIACELSVGELRSTLTGDAPLDRSGLLDLLDLLLGAEARAFEDIAARIPLMDCLITFLCGGPEGDTDAAALQDPVGLTPRLQSFCEKAESLADPELEEIETRFFAAAQMSEGNALEASQAADLKQCKLDLGASYFVPSLLRAIVTYNVAMLRRTNDELSRAQDWGSLPGNRSMDGDSGGSVFETTALPALGEALRRRAAGGSTRSGAIDRIAWCLDLAYPNSAEREALLSPTVGSAEDVKGTVILVGLLCRSAVVLEAELPSIGISPEHMSSDWVKELDDALKTEIQGMITGDAYADACVLSELKSKFLYKPITDLSAKKTRRPTAPKQSKPSGSEERLLRREANKEAGELAGAAVGQASEGSAGGRVDWKAARGWRTWTAGTAVAAAAALLALAMRPTGDLQSFSQTELHNLSPYLVHGGRNGEGSGPAFVGTIGDDWFDLAVAQRDYVATELVENLRTQGIRQIMIYDDHRNLRIQALGAQPVRIVDGNP